MDFIEALTKIINVSSPWKIEEIKVNPPTKTVNVFIHYEEGATFPCSKCNKDRKVYDSNYRIWRHLDICDYRCYLNIKIPRINCPEHGILVIKELPFGRMNGHYSFQFDLLIMRKVREMSVRALGVELGEPDQNIWRVFHYYINQGKQQIDCYNTRRIGVDEKSYKKGHQYVSIFTDLDTGHVIFVTPGKGEETFAQFYEYLFENTGDPNNIQQISMDMGKGYISGYQMYFSSAELVFDRFHIKKALNEQVDKVRKQEVKHNESLKNTRYIWLKNECNLTDKQRDLLGEFLKESSTNTAKSYQAKVAFDQLWRVQNNAVEPLLNQWLLMAHKLCLKPISDFVKTVISHKKGIINSMKSLVTNAVAEGLNSLFQLAKSRARGFRNITNFMNMIYFLGNDFIFSTH
jgi:transposase